MSDVVLGKEKPVEESNPEYEKLKHYIFELENHLAEAQKHAYRLVKRHRGIKGFSYMYVLCVNFPGIRLDGLSEIIIRIQGVSPKQYSIKMDKG